MQLGELEVHYFIIKNGSVRSSLKKKPADFKINLYYLIVFYRVSLTYRVKSAHKLKLTDKQLLQWMAPILLIMLVYLCTWTLSAPPDAEVVSILASSNVTITL